MEPDTHVVALCGSLRDESGTRAALGTALDAAEAAGATTTLVDLRTYDLPLVDADEASPADAESLRRTLRDADAILLGTPMYHGSYSSPLKTALDYCGFEEFEDKTVGLLAVSGGRFPTSALEHLRSVCRALNAWTLPLEVGVSDAHSSFADGELTDPTAAERVRRLGEHLVLFAGVEQYPEVASATIESVTGF
ncbi:FMN reductase [Haladaptatus sp. W1]|uniref:NADPH-dependent FMN reductase n=1 Tax=Haladaptatus sp. W1 TaxID=1897478 RepID=UPI00084983D8|nr:NADPH-dependent FMN reductase [Haladaptatus sp. W1]ODR80021.1 FMN reductase [Haladaptatus sp. W1]